MTKLRVGVIGLGVGKSHIKGYQSHPDAEVVALADPNEARLEEVGDAFNVPSRYTTAKAMLREEKLDAVSVCTPNKFHKALSIAGLQAGCHVLCEKPMAMNAREGREMLAAAKKAKKRLMINFSYRFMDQSVAMKNEVERGTLGDIYFARTVWHRRRGMPGFGGWFGQKKLAGGGPLIDLGVHRLDLALWLMGYPKPVYVMGAAYNPIGSAIARREKKAFDVEDLAVGFVRFANGATLEIEASWAANVKEKELMQTRLLGSEGGMLQYNMEEGYKFEAEVYLERDGAQYDMCLHRAQNLTQGAMHHFVQSILDKKPHTATGEEGLIVMELLDAIYKSAKTGKPVKL